MLPRCCGYFLKTLIMSFYSLTKLLGSPIDIRNTGESFYFRKWVRWEWDFMKLFFFF